MVPKTVVLQALTIHVSKCPLKSSLHCPLLDSHANGRLTSGVIFCSSSWYCIKYSEPLVFHQTSRNNFVFYGLGSYGFSSAPFSCSVYSVRLLTTQPACSCSSVLRKQMYSSLVVLPCVDLCKRLDCKMVHHDRLFQVFTMKQLNFTFSLSC